MAAAPFVTDEAEGEGGDEGDDEDMGEGEKKVEESARSKTHERNQTEGELNPSEAENEENVGDKLLPKTNWLQRS